MRFTLGHGLLRTLTEGAVCIALVTGVSGCAQSDGTGSSTARNLAAESELPSALRIDLAEAEVESVSEPGTWQSARTIYEGSPARLSIELDAPEATRMEAVVTMDGVDAPLGQASLDVPAGVSTIELPVDIDGAAWLSQDGANSPNSADHVTLRVSESTSDAPPQEVRVPVKVAPRPVVFIHGMWSSASWWDSYVKPGGFLKASNPLWQGFAVDTMDTGSAWSPLSPVKSVEENAALAWQFIDERMRETNAHQVDVVTHSLGGIIARRILHDSQHGKQAQGAIRSAVMLGTPNGGSPCSESLVVPGNRELTFSAMEAFNKEFPGYPGVHSVSLYSDHWSTTCFADGDGDSMVPAWSTQAQPVDESRLMSPGVDHANMTYRERVFTDYIRPILTAPEG